MIENEKIKKFGARDGVNIYFMAILCLLGLQILFSMIYVTLGIEENTKGYYIFSYTASLFFQIGYLAVFAAYLKSRKIKPQIFIQTKISPVFYAAAIIAPLICFLFFFPASAAFDVLLDIIKYPNMPDLETSGAFEVVLMILATVILAPVCEELIYRSALISGLKDKYSSDFKGALICVVLGGAAFSLMHMNPRQTVFQFFLGATAVILALTSKSVIPSIILHFLNNLIVVLCYFFEPFNAPFALMSDTLLSTNAGLILSSVFFTAAGIAALFVLWLLLKKHSDRVYGAEDTCQATEGATLDTADENRTAQNGLTQNGLLGGIRTASFAKENKNFYTGLTLGLGICVLVWAGQLITGILG